MKKLFLPLWVISAFFLFLYSYTQVDLSLTLSSQSILRDVETSFQHIGWFERNLSTYLYIGLLVLLFVLYIWTLLEAFKNKLSVGLIKKAVIAIGVILLFSYVAFSYDMFNYIFDARIVTHYHQNPYLMRALDFPNDPMLSFMRSTHRVYPYGPVWLLFTVPLTFIGSQFFIITFFLFKTLSAISYLLSSLFIYKIARKLKLNNPFLAVSFFAFNPLVLVEALVSSHNEIVMVFLAVVALWATLANRKILSIVILLLSIGIKYTTVILLPVLIIFSYFPKYVSKEKLVIYLALLSLIGAAITAFASGQNKNPEFQPWYLLTAAPFVALIENRLRILYIAISFFSLLSYIPFLYSGIWPENIVLLKNILVAAGCMVGICAIGLFTLVGKKRSR